jgi:alpha-D-ribose 1-methylphosphonate 5-triphosphate synthase subunit PhnH
VISASADTLLPGLRDPVFDSQRAFRAALDALARPGRVQDVGVELDAPAPLGHAAAALLLALADFETPLWLQTTQAAPAQYLRFHCGSLLVADPAAACFAFVHDAGSMPALAAFNQGENDYPDRSTTLIVQVRALSAGAGAKLHGPGIRGSAALTAEGLPARFWDEWRGNAALFPRGVDVILVAGSRIAGLPRTTQVED